MVKKYIKEIHQKEGKNQHINPHNIFKGTYVRNQLPNYQINLGINVLLVLSF